MALETTDSKKIYVGDGSSVAFSFPYLFLKDADLEVSLYDTVAETSPVVKTIITDYTVTGALDENGGTVTMVVAPLSTEELIIERVVGITQISGYTNFNRFPAVTVETGYDKLTMICQQLDRLVGSSFKVETNVDTSSFTPSVEGPLVAHYVPSLKSDLSGMEWTNLNDISDLNTAVTAAELAETNAASSASAASSSASAASTSETNAAASAVAAAASAAIVGLNRVTFSCTSVTQVVIDSGSIFTGFDSGTQFAFTSSRTFDITGSAGDLGALNTGTEASGTWYYLIALGDTTAVTAPHIIGVTAANYASFTTADLTGNYAVYDDYKRIGAVRNDGSSNFIQCEYFNGKLYYDTQVSVTGISGTSFANVDCTAACPLIAREVEVSFYNGGVGSDSFWRMDGSSGSSPHRIHGNVGTNPSSAVSANILLSTVQIFEGKTSSGTVVTAIANYVDNLENEGQ